MLKKLLGVGVMLALVATVLVGVGASTASAQSMSLCQTVDALIAAGVIAPDKVASAKAAAGCDVAMASAYTFTRDLTVGASGADVTALQNFLLSNGNSIPAGATGYFGAQTQAALAAYQAAKGISPAVGYFGPITMAYINANVVTPVTPPVGGTFPAGCTSAVGFSATTGLSCSPVGLPAGCTSTVGYSPTTGASCSTGAPGTPSMSGDEGELDTFNSLTGLDSSVDEGQEDVKVFGVKFEAEDSDMMINRIDVEISTSDAGSGESSQLDDYITEVSLMIDGDKVATMDVDDASEDDDVYTFRFKGLDNVVKEDATAKVYVLVSAVNNIDSGDTAVNLSVDIQADGIRATDGAGISDEYVSDSTFTAKTFSVGEEDTASVSISSSDEDPDASILVVDDEDDSSEYVVFVFDAESEDSDSTIDTVTIDVVSASSTVNALIKDLTLTVGGEDYDGTIASTTASSTSFSFDVDNDVTMDADEDVEFVVKAVFNQQVGNYSATGESVIFSLDAADLDTEDSNTGDSNTETGSADGASHSLSLVGVSVTMVDVSTVTSVDGGNGDYVTHKLTLSVKSLEDTIYVPLNATTTASTTAGFVLERIQAWTGTTTINIIQTSDLDVDTVYGSVKISKGQTATIEITVVNNPTADGFVGLELDTVRFSETAGAYGITFTVPDTSAYQTTNSFVPAD